MRIYRFLVLFLSIMSCEQSYASGFQLEEQDAAGSGDYHAGSAAQALDASTEFYNPAGLTHLSQPQIIVGGTSIFSHVNFNGSVTDELTTNIDEGSVQGSFERFIPDLHFAYPWHDFAFGFGVTVPFGLGTSYPENSIAKNAATSSEIQIINVGPSIAYQFNHAFSLGLGLDLQTANIKMNNMVADSIPDYNTGRGFGKTWHGGVLYQFNDDARVGVAYHAGITQHIRGTSTALALATNDHLGGNLPLPAYTVISFYQRLNPRWELKLSVRNSQWHTFNTLILDTPAGSDTPVTLPQNAHNTWDERIGLGYQLNDQWLLRTGFGYDPTPTNNQYRDLRLPDSDHYAFAVGGHYQYSKELGFDMGWTYLLYKPRTLNTTQILGTNFLGNNTIETLGQVNNHANVVGIGIVVNM